MYVAESGYVRRQVDTVGEYYGAGIRNATACGFVYKHCPEEGISSFLRKVGVYGNTGRHIPENLIFRQRIL
jgi:hypothetical protein